jgi:hypothetical protein
MAVNITLTIRLGPLVSLKVTGQSCEELAQALEGYDHLNQRVDAMCSDLAERVYPEGVEMDYEQHEGEEEAAE